MEKIPQLLIGGTYTRWKPGEFSPCQSLWRQKVTQRLLGGRCAAGFQRENRKLIFQQLRACFGFTPPPVPSGQNKSALKVDTKPLLGRQYSLLQTCLSQLAPSYTKRLLHPQQ